jgi:hypothetical protein
MQLILHVLMDLLLNFSAALPTVGESRLFNALPTRAVHC